MTNAGGGPPTLELSDGPPPRPRQRRSIAKRERILEEARAAFTEFGYQRAQIEEITARAGIATGAFYLSFRSKRQLLVELMNELLRVLASLTLSLDSGREARDALHELLRAALRADRASYGVIKAWLEAVETDDELRALNLEIQRWTTARVLGVFELVLERTASPPPRDLGVFAKAIDRYLWMLLGRMADMSDAEFDAEARVTGDMIFFYLLGAS